MNIKILLLIIVATANIYLISSYSFYSVTIPTPPSVLFFHMNILVRDPTSTSLGRKTH